MWAYFKSTENKPEQTYSTILRTTHLARKGVSHTLPPLVHRIAVGFDVRWPVPTRQCCVALLHSLTSLRILDCEPGACSIVWQYHSGAPQAESGGGGELAGVNAAVNVPCVPRQGERRVLTHRVLSALVAAISAMRAGPQTLQQQVARCLVL